MEFGEVVLRVVQVIEAVAVGILALGVAGVMIRALAQFVGRPDRTGIYREVRDGLGRVLLLGLEVLIAADIIATVALDLTLESAASLGLIVLIRTFLTWAIEVETDGRWPWQGSQGAQLQQGAVAAD
jgi:uncharacterized membrane protein